MTLVHLTTTSEKTESNPFGLNRYHRVLKAAQNSRFTQHQITDDPAEAELILFIGSKTIFHSDVFGSKVYQQYPAKSLILDYSDQTIPKLPGIYMTIPKRLHKTPIYQYGFYQRVFDNHILDNDIPIANCQYLYSFVGTVSTYSSLRSKIVNLTHPRACVRDKSSPKTSLEQDYAQLLQNSKFILCPRGSSPSTFRIFEAMRAGRVPIIISDEWFPPRNINWSDFSLRVSENNISKIPTLLEKLEPEAERMGKIARQVWENNFAVDTGFQWIMDTCNFIQSQRKQFQELESRAIWLEAIFYLPYKRDIVKFAKEKLKDKLGAFKN